MKRRKFLIGTAAAVGLVGTSRGWASTPARTERAPVAAAQSGNQAKLARIAILSLNFDRILKTEGQQDPARTLDVLDLPQMFADRYGVRRVELQHAHFASTEPAYLKEFRDRIAKAKSQLIQINLEFGGSNVSAGGLSARLQAIDLTKQWIDHAEVLGCPRVMVNQGSLAPEVRQNAIDALKILAGYGKAHKVMVTVQNRDTGVAPPAPTPPATPPPAPAPGAPSTGSGQAPAGGGRGGGGRGTAGPPPPPATWQIVVEVIKAAGISANPDIGNFPNEAERAAGLRVMYPLSSGGSHCQYNPEKYDFANAIRISKDAGYKGLYSIETGSHNGPDPYAATAAILDELVRNM